MLNNDNARDETPLSDDMLKGAKRIAAFSGLEEREVYDYAKSGEIPAFKVGKHWCSLKSELRARLRSNRSAD